MISYVLSALVLGVASLIWSGAQYAAAATVTAGILDVVANFCMQTLLAPVSWIALVLFYYDQRIRTEGYDIEWMMEQAGLLPQQAKNGLAGDPGLAQLASAAPLGEGETISGPAVPPDTVGEQ